MSTASGAYASAYWQSDAATLLLGDARSVVGELPSGSVDCIVTSPPYYGLRDYDAVGQIGSEPDADLYLDALAAVLRSLHRVLADDGTLWLNLGDTYERKSLLGIPGRASQRARRAGWLVRNEIVWHKPNAMPESVRDRLGGRYETLFLLVKSPRYHFDLDAIRVPHHPDTIARARRAATPYEAPGQSPNIKAKTVPSKGANPGDVWAIANTGFRGAHFATFPVELPLRCISAGCKPGGTVLDPFSGAGTTGVAARQLGRRYVGVDINPAFHDLAIGRLNGDQLTLSDEGAA